jgi:hypothetical protein
MGAIFNTQTTLDILEMLTNVYALDIRERIPINLKHSRNGGKNLSTRRR